MSGCCDHRGFSLLETLAAAALSVLIFSSLLAAFLAVKSINQVALHRIAAIEIVRGQIELLKATPFSGINDQTQTDMNFFSGIDGVADTSDDLKGTLRVMIQDSLDMDNDCASNPLTCKTENAIDIDGDGTNDPDAVKPVRVSFTWNEKVLGQMKSYTVWADTLIAA